MLRHTFQQVTARPKLRVTTHPRRKINLSHVFVGQNVGIKEVAEKIWLVTFMDYDLRFFDQEAGRVECAQNPFRAQVLPMSPE